VSHKKALHGYFCGLFILLVAKDDDTSESMVYFYFWHKQLFGNSSQGIITLFRRNEFYEMPFASICDWKSG
jgi:hypothetical protein